MEKQIVTRATLKRAVRGLGLSGLPLCIHSSLRSFGWVDGGPDAIVDALLAEGCTVMVPSFSGAFSIPPPIHMRPPQNGCDYDLIDHTGNASVSSYTPDSPEVDHYLGAVAAAVVAWPGRSRGNNPISSFAAVGPLADQLIAGQTAVDVFAPLQALAAAGGAVVLMGVGLDNMTLLHLAEFRAGRTPFRRWARDANGAPVMAAVGGCSRGFPRLDAVLAPTRRERWVGRSRWQVFDAASVLEVAAEAIRTDPGITRCDDAECERCRDAVRGGPRLRAAGL
jgi:aminoglycoside N3'-acetyltransferase